MAGSIKAQVKEWNRDAYPALYRCADDAARNAQWWYFLWVKVNLTLLVSGGIAASISISDETLRRIVQGIIAACFFGALAATLLMAYHRWDKVWYAGRAVSESVKSLSWKFMMGADPFPETLPPATAVERFTDTLRELVKEYRHLSVALTGKEMAGEQVTDLMTGIRDSAVGVMRDVYLAQRIADQQAWYSRMAAANKRKQTVWFVLLVVFQATAGAAALLLIWKPDMLWRASSVFGAFATATIAWGQVKRFQESAQAYGLAAQELSLIAARGPHIATREKLARFVNDAETAISREHSMWVARRETK